MDNRDIIRTMGRFPDKIFEPGAPGGLRSVAWKCSYCGYRTLSPTDEPIDAPKGGCPKCAGIFWETNARPEVAYTATQQKCVAVICGADGQPSLQERIRAARSGASIEAVAERKVFCPELVADVVAFTEARKNWLNDNPIRKYMLQEKIGFCALSEWLGRRIKPFTLQRLAMGFIPMGSLSIQTLMRCKGILFKDRIREWAAWYKAEPELQFTEPKAEDGPIDPIGPNCAGSKTPDCWRCRTEAPEEYYACHDDSCRPGKSGAPEDDTEYITDELGGHHGGGVGWAP